MKPNTTYRKFIKEVTRFIPTERLFTDELHTLAWGTDAGFYRLLPQVVIQAANEQEVSELLQAASSHHLPVTFRAAGTSLSGQAISDSILIVAGKHWENYTLADNYQTITMQPGLIGQRVNDLLAPHGRKFAPDPASIKSAMVGGIVMNNASGMNCGTHANSDRMLLSVRLVLMDGTTLDTGCEESKNLFRQSHADFIKELCAIRDEIRQNRALCERIRYKYRIKNVTGLNLLPFVLYDDPFEIITHSLVGSEGTLAFLSEVTMKTERDYPYKASAMLYFSEIEEACRAVIALKKLTDKTGNTLVKSAELLDAKSLASVNDTTGVGLTALLTETKGETPEEVAQHILQIEEALQPFHLAVPVYFTNKPEEYAQYWAIRSGIFPSVGGTRPLGTTCLIEDVAFHLDDLPQATAHLQQLLAQNGYHDACIYGHALEGNYHFIINQSFATEPEVSRYEKLMDEVKHLVVDQYDGSLKAEHGTGRNMAPFVGYEWGEEAFTFMKRIKALFDPKGLLNPGVIFNDDPQCHLKHFKPLPLTNPHVDRCIECGFCEVNCLTCGFTLSSRQRIVTQREISQLKRSGKEPDRLKRLEKQYAYAGNQTCAGDGLCAMSCPMGINTGHLTHDIRQAQLPKNSLSYRLGEYTANHFAGTKAAVRPVLTLAHTVHQLLGTPAMSNLTKGLHQTLGIPQWTPAMPKSFKLHPETQQVQEAKVVYFPSCINQTMGIAHQSPVEQALANKMIALLQKAGYELLFPENMENLCCGTIWESKGMPAIADQKTTELEAALWEASAHGRYPVLCDQSPCLYRMREKIKKIPLYEPVEFIYTFLQDKLEFTPTDRPITIHATCSMRKMKLDKMLFELAQLCSHNVFVPEEIGCCGFAGDKGFTHPEVNQYALRKLRPQLEEHHIHIGYSNSRTCEIGLTTHTGIPYVSIVYLVDACTQKKNKRQTI
ncbi:MAG: FAD-binding oxidoreductase [Bacteroidia bacterium]|nr:FAD-binding oxidoreductase [Bacteroidia bacterium]